MKVRWVLVGYVAACALLVLSLVVRWAAIHLPFPDLTVLWSGARAANPYDAVDVTNIQRALRPIIGPLPFLYPPSALPLLFPFALLPFKVAFWLWTCLSIGAFWSAARKFTNHVWLAFLTPHAIFSLALGQTALFTGSAILWGVALLETQPLLAGSILGFGMALKPQVLFLAPLALIAAQQWKALASLLVTWAILALPLLPLWPQWWSTTQNLSADIANHWSGVVTLAVTPSYFARAIGAPVLPFQLAGIIAGVAIVWLSFRSDDKAKQVVGLVSGTLLAAPYALHYELAAATPVYMAAVMSNGLRGALVAIPLICVNVLAIVPALLISATAVLLDHSATHPYSIKSGGRGARGRRTGRRRRVLRVPRSTIGP